MSIHYICHHCHGPFKDDWDGLRCDSCDEPTHRNICGEYRTFQTPREVIAHFLCLSCLTIED